MRQADRILQGYWIKDRGKRHMQIGRSFHGEIRRVRADEKANPWKVSGPEPRRHLDGMLKDNRIFGTLAVRPLYRVRVSDDAVNGPPHRGGIMVDRDTGGQ